MTEEQNARRQASEAKSAAPRHSNNFKHNVAPLLNALQHLAPDGSRQSMLAAFDNRTTWNTIRDWRRGKRALPQWARDLLKTKAAAINAAAIDSPYGPGQLSGLRNMPHEIRQR